MSEQPKLVTEPHNPFLLNTFRAFMAECQNPALAAQMTMAHIEHGQMAIMNEVAKQLHRIADALTDPVEIGRIIALVRAGDAKRAQSAVDREKAEADARFNRILNASDAELAS